MYIFYEIHEQQSESPQTEAVPLDLVFWRLRCTVSETLLAVFAFILFFFTLLQFLS